MNVLGIGPLELIFVIIIMILVLGPQQMVSTARKAGALIRKVVKSPMWSTIMDTSREIREIPTRLVREAGLEEDLREIRSSTQTIKDLKNISVSTDPLSFGDRIISSDKPVASVPNDSESSTNQVEGDTKLESNSQTADSTPPTMDPGHPVEEQTSIESHANNSPAQVDD